MCNPTFSLNVKTNVTKTFLQLMDTHFPRANKLNKIFKSNTVKVSYSCTQIISQIIKRHNKKVTQIQWHYQLEFNCPIKSECPLNSDCLKEDVIYRCTSLTTLYPKRVYLCIADIKMQRYYNSTQWSQNENYSNSATLQLCLENKENEKGNTKISLGNNSNCCTIHKHNNAMFFISLWEICYTHVSKSEWTFKQKIEASFKVSAWK